jgi:glutathione S-transferase
VPADIPNAREDFAQMAAVLEEHLKSRQFLVGNTATVADFIMAYTLDWANEIQLLEGFPNLKNYMTKMYARPHAAPRIAAAFASLGINPGQN